MINMLLCVFTASLADQFCLLPNWKASVQKLILHHLMDKQNIHVLQANKKDSPVHEAPALRGSGKGSDHLGSLYAAFPANFAGGCFHDLNPWPPGHKAAPFTTAPRLPFKRAARCMKLPLCAGSGEGSDHFVTIRITMYRRSNNTATKKRSSYLCVLATWIRIGLGSDVKFSYYIIYTWFPSDFWSKIS
jgi:hypothetical protein